jgi:Ca-activated chloride channel family protein
MNSLLSDETRKRGRLPLKMRLAGIFAGLAAVLSTAVQPPRFLVSAATQPEKITVTVPVVVTDPLGRIVAQLQKEHFKLYEDRIEQEITGFNADSSEVSVVVAVNGISQDPTIERMLNAVTAAGHPSDEFELVRLNAGTGLMDGLRTAIERSRSLRNARRGIVIVSFGSDTRVYSQEETKAIATSMDVPIFALSTAANSAIKPLLDDLARFTGGQHYAINNASDLDQRIVRIDLGIRNSYLLTYDSANMARDGRYRQIRVRVVPPVGLPPFTASHRDGYFAPRS